MLESVVVAVVTGLFALFGTLLSNRQHMKEIDHKLDLRQTVTETKIDSLTREVREHNNFAQRIPVIEEQIRVANHRIEDLERGAK